MKYKKAQLDKIQTDFGLVYFNYGEADERLLGPTRGGATFEATQILRDIEYDGRLGKTKGLQTIDFIDAKLMVPFLSISIDDLKLILPQATVSGTAPAEVLTVAEESLGVIPDDDYIKNITMFAKTLDGKFKKITLYNAMNEAPMSLAAVDKAEGVVNLEIFAHWEVDEDDPNNVDKLYMIEEVDTITVA